MTEAVTVTEVPEDKINWKQFGVELGLHIARGTIKLTQKHIVNKTDTPIDNVVVGVLVKIVDVIDEVI